jgi:hypothetical protein
MSEGYLILNGNESNLLQVNLLIDSIKRFDKTRNVSVVTNNDSLKFHGAENVILLSEQNPTLCYFKSLLASPYTKTIGLLPDQILTMFNASVWENLRGLSPLVLLENRFSFCNMIIDPAMYVESSTELKSFNIESIPSAIFLNKEKGADDVLGLATILSSNYNQDDYINFFSDKDNMMPSFPRFIWPAWILSLLQVITEDKISKFDFMHCIDLSKQENNFNNQNWTRNWSEFLTYWVNDQGVLKIENFVQHGLVKYSSAAWLTENTLTNLRMNE